MTSLKLLDHMISSGQPIPVKTIDGALFPHILVQPDFNNTEELKKYDSIIDWSQSLFKKIPGKNFDIKNFEHIKSSGRAHLTETINSAYTIRSEKYLRENNLSLDMIPFIPKELSFYDTIEENFKVAEIYLYYSAQSEAIYQRQKKKYESNHLVCYEPKLVRVKKQDIKHLDNFPYQLKIDIYLAKDPKEHIRQKSLQSSL